MRARAAKLLRGLACGGAMVGLAGCHPAGMSPDAARDLEPGLYRSTVTLEDVAFPGVARAQAAALKAMFSRAPQQRTCCIGGEEAAQGGAALARRLVEGKCRFERLERAHGQLRGAAVCQTAHAQTVRDELTGRWTSTGAHLERIARSEVRGLAGGVMVMRESVQIVRIRACLQADSPR